MSVRWPPERTEHLRKLLADGLSASQAARELGVTRSAVIGKASRNGINFVRAPSSNHGVPRRRARSSDDPMKYKRERDVADMTKNTSIRSLLIARARATGELPTAEPIKLPSELLAYHPITLFDLKSWHCRWPIDDNSGHVVGFCGNRRYHDTVSYCLVHCRMAFFTWKMTSKGEN